MDKVLIDTKYNGKEVNDWDGKKENNLLLAESFRRLNNIPKSIRVEKCGTYLEFRRYTDKSLKLNRANFCKVRLCPLCAWRRSLKIFGQVSTVMDEATKDKDYEYIFLTLTLRNCSGYDLSETIDTLMYSFEKLSKRKRFKDSVKGFFRALEVTHELKTDTYHPHFHCILMVNKSYFRSRDYISQEEWTSIWKKCLKVDYSPIVHVTKYRDYTGRGMSKGIAEVAKYTVKDTDYIIKDRDTGEVIEELTDDAVFNLDLALKHRRLTSFGGILKEIHQLLNLDDPEDGDLINTDNDDKIRDDLEYIIESYHWHVGYKAYIRID